MEPKIATVSQINGYIKKLLDANLILNNVWIKGEISNFKLHYSGHMYITLKDEKSVLKAVMFKSAVKSLSFVPSDGMKVMARGRITVYEAGGQYQLYIEEMIPDGVGDLYVRFEKLKKQLSEEGLFDPQFKKPIPRFPEKIGVATATTGAAVRDIINVISRRYPHAEIIIYPTQVQGQGAAENIVEAIEYFNACEPVDTLIIGRGGGSIEDLWAFNEEIVARAVFASEIPIISAVGHETDFTIADFAADLRAPTPSAAAEISVPSSTELIGTLTTAKTRMYKAVLNGFQRRRLLIENLKPKNPTDKIQENSLRMDGLIKSARHALEIKLMQDKRILGETCSKLNALSPLSVMARGYGIAMDEAGNVKRSKNDFSPQESFTLKLSDGDVSCRAESIQNGEPI